MAKCIVAISAQASAGRIANLNFGSLTALKSRSSTVSNNSHERDFASVSARSELSDVQVTGKTVARFSHLQGFSFE